jgi:uncharacterized protein YecT (DUF1311 family)
VEKDECCDVALCPAGTVFQFKGEPECLPCGKATGQMQINFCEIQAAERSDDELNAAYSKLSADFPTQQSRLKAAERAWITFRNKLCDAYSGPFKGGSVEPELHERCVDEETRRQIGRLKDLRDVWSPIGKPTK